MEKIDLFGKPIKPLRRGKKSSAGLGNGRPMGPPENQVQPKSVAPRTGTKVRDDDTQARSGLGPRRALQRYLRKQAIPFVDADKVKADLFSAERLHLFDFVVHREETSWLLAACDGSPNNALVSDLREWERILGRGFQAVIARIDEENAITFHNIEGEKVDIT